MKTLHALAIGIATLSACSANAPQFMPIADSTPVTLTNWVGVDFDVRLQAMDQAQGGIVLSVNRVSGKALDYSDGKLAKDVALFFCASLGKTLNPHSYGHFNVLGGWMFEGGCL